MTEELLPTLARLSTLMKDSQTGPYRVAPEIEKINANWATLRKGSGFYLIQTAMKKTFGPEWTVARFAKINRTLARFGLDIAGMLEVKAANWATNHVPMDKTGDFVCRVVHEFNQNAKNPLGLYAVRKLAKAGNMYNPRQRVHRCHKCDVLERRLAELQTDLDNERKRIRWANQLQYV